jgi:F0F1-type ATP synthase assembly protein I
LISSPRRDTGTPAIDPDVKKMWRIAGNTGAVGIEIAVAVFIGYYGGRFLDRKLGTEPWISYAGLLAGIGAAIKALLRVIRSYRRDVADIDNAKSTGPNDSQRPKST